LESKGKKSRKEIGSKASITRGAILKAAESIFADRGFHDTSMSKIAKSAKVSEATVYDYFSSKEELLFAIPGERVTQFLKKNIEILEFVQGAAEKVRVLIYRYLKTYDSELSYGKIMMMILKTNRNFLKTEQYEIIRESSHLLITVLEEGIKNGEFRPDMDPYIIRAMIWGSIEHLVIRRTLLGKPKDLLPLADQITNAIFKGILVAKKEPTLNVNVTLVEKRLGDHKNDPR